jgi:P4 family phage/plasmid primase-like protien
MTASNFLSMLWGQKPAGWVEVWNLQSKRSTSFSDLTTVDRFIAAYPDQDWYTGAGLAAQACRPQERVKSIEVIGIAGLWADVDYAHPVHQKPNLPTDEAAARWLISKMPVPPTVLVHTGHGLQAWWLFSNPWVFSHAQERTQAAALIQSWQAMLRNHAQQHGWTLDSTHDLARLMRLPGTYNHKAAPVPVRVLSDNGPREPPEKYLSLVTPGPDSMPATLTETANLRLLPDATPPEKKLASLKENSGKFRRTLERRRPDLPDQSASGYDLSLASQAAAVGWTDQEISNLLIWNRAYHGDELKLREDYYQRTIGQARATSLGHQTGQYPPRGGDDKGLTKHYTDLILAQDYFARDGSGNLYVYQQGCYRSQGENHIKRQFQLLLEGLGKTKHWNVRRRTEVIEYIRDQASQLWDGPPADFINVKNGLLHVETRELLPHSPDFLSLVQLPIDYDPEAQCPATEIFVAEVFPEDAQQVAWEIIAWLMTPDISLQKAIMLVGDGSNGKSTWLTSVINFLGKSNVSALSLHKLETDRFSPARLMGKLANICPDLPTTHLASTSTFKAIVGGDPLPAERKFRDSFEFNPFARLVFSTNEAPQSGDASFAFLRRWLVIPFHHTFEENKIRKDTLDAQLADAYELSGVLNKALDALPRVRDQGITETGTMAAAFLEFQTATDPIAVWLDSNVVEGPDHYVAKGLLYSKYQDDALEHLSDKKFGKRLKEIYPQVKDGLRTIKGKGVRCWLGLGLRRTDEG